MTLPIIDPEHLFEQAEALIALGAAGPPRQVNIRRAISASYYAVFHATLTAAADEFVGVSLRSSTRYALVYRSVDHRTLRALCEELNKPTLPLRYAPHRPPNGFGADLTAFAFAVLELQRKRHEADYDPMPRACSVSMQNQRSRPAAKR